MRRCERCGAPLNEGTYVCLDCKLSGAPYDNISKMQNGRKKNALGTMVSIILLIIFSVASWLCSIKARVEIMYSNEDTFAICALVLAIISYILIVALIIFGTRILKMIDGRGVAFYLVVGIGVALIAIMLILTIPSLVNSISLI